MELMEVLTSLRDRAHGITKEELSGAEGGRERREQAMAIQARLNEIRDHISAAPEAERSILDDIRHATERYLVLFTIEDSPPERDQTLLTRAQRLHSEVIDYARGMVQAELDTPVHNRAVMDFRSRLDELLAEPGPRTPDLERVLGDADLDVEFVRHRGQAPSSIRLARESRS